MNTDTTLSLVPVAACLPGEAEREPAGDPPGGPGKPVYAPVGAKVKKGDVLIKFEDDLYLSEKPRFLHWLPY